jgi:YD repeat-containing protein
MTFIGGFPHAKLAFSAALLAVPIGGFSCAAGAAETTTYTYDALGRLIEVNSAGSVNDGLSLTYTYDPAGNRVAYEVAGSGNEGVPERIVVVIPSNPPSSGIGYAIIPINQ